MDGKGWAHDAAHGADALDELVRCEEIGQEGLRKVLHAIYNKVCISYYGYIHEEDVIIKINVKPFLRSLYFRLLDQQEYVKIVREIKKVLEKMNQYK